MPLRNGLAPRHPHRDRRTGFTLIELLVVVGIIALLLAILLPSLRRARLQAQAVACASNLQQLHKYMVMYANENRGYMFPVGPADSNGKVTTLGTNVAPHQRWVPILFEIRIDPLPYSWPDDVAGQAAYRASENGISDEATQKAHMETYDAIPFTPPVLACPSDKDPYEGHSYVVNHTLVQQDIPVRLQGGNLGGKTSADVIVAGEKRTTVRDYHMERGFYPLPRPDPITGQLWPSEFDRVVEPYRHGISLGSNYLFLDGHVNKELPNNAIEGVDPWTVTAPTPTPTPTP